MSLFRSICNYLFVVIITTTLGYLIADSSNGKVNIDREDLNASTKKIELINGEELTDIERVYSANNSKNNYVFLSREVFNGSNFRPFFNPSYLDSVKDVQIYRTIMPDAGPSAFAIRFPDVGLALCYDSVRGGVNYVWHGDFDLSPTVAKVHDIVEIKGEPFYRETDWHPLRLMEDVEETKTDYRFRGYTVHDGILEFHYNINGSVEVRERITPIEDRGIRRDFEVQSTVESLALRIEPQEQSTVEVEGGVILDNGWAVFRGEPLQGFAVTIMRKQEKE